MNYLPRHFEPGHFDPRLTAAHSGYLCWTRMQAEAGQQLTSIVERKELERRAGDGLFFWGVGNAPSALAQPLARLGMSVPVVFSVMKSAPKKVDVRPSGILAWNAYIDCIGIERDLPEHVLVTSRSETGAGPKKTHFALMCRSTEPLAVQEGVPFNHHGYRNAGAVGAPVGASQVTALLESCADEPERPAQYSRSMQAELAGSYWVKLTRPVPVAAEHAAMQAGDETEHLKVVSLCRGPKREILPAAGLLL